MEKWIKENKIICAFIYIFAVLVVSLMVYSNGQTPGQLVDPPTNETAVGRSIIPLNSFIFSDGLVEMGFADTFVSARGTWISDTDIHNPIQSSSITCLRNSMTCIEARGEVSKDGYLIVNSYLFDIGTWNEREIVTKSDDSLFGCTRYIMRFDRIQKQVTATRTTISNEGDCSAVDTKPIHLYLGDGLEMWRKLRTN